MTTNKLTLKTSSNLRHSHDEIFQEGRFKVWRKGQITNPRWLKREIGHDFITVANESEVKDVEQYLSGNDPRLSTEKYNSFSTGIDKADNEMICLYHTNDVGDQKKLAIIIALEDDLAMQLVEIVEQYCGE